MKKSLRPIGILSLLALGLSALVLIFRPNPQQEPEPGPQPGKLVVRFLDVGQGDSELIQLPTGETVLIDSGDRGAPTVELLRKYRVNKIDLIIATHPHSDHIGEMRDVMRAFKVSEFWDSGFNHPTKTYGDMLQDVLDRRIKFATPKRGDIRQFGDVLLEVLNPGEQPPDNNPNNASIVVRLTFGSRRFLFTGDAEMSETSKPSAWGQMLELEPGQLQADLLKGAHHGSSDGTTSDVLAAVNPSVITISCGAGNDYHHPHPRLMNALDQAGDSIRIFRTDLEGTITAVSDGKTIEMTAEREITGERLYLTGDEVAGTVASDSRTGRKTARRRGGRER
jgi:competence protein ComEC